MSTVVLTSPPAPLHLRLVEGGTEPLNFRSTSATYLASLREIKTAHSPAEWTDTLSVKAFAWMEEVLSYHADALTTEDELLRKVQERIEGLNELLVNPLNGKPLEDPVLENGHVWERRELDDYMTCFQAVNVGGVISAYSEEEPEYIDAVKAHAFLMSLISWRDSLPFGRVFERSGAAGPVPLIHTLVLSIRKDALVVRAPEREPSSNEMLAQVLMYRYLALAALSIEGNKSLRKMAKEVVHVCEREIAALKASTEAKAAELAARLEADRRETGVRIDGIESTYAAAERVKEAQIGDMRERLADSHEKLVHTRGVLDTTRAEVAALQRANADLRNQLNNIDTDSGGGCAVM